MSAIERMALILIEVEGLLEDIKEETDSITVAQARRLHSSILEAEGWLQSSRKLLDPPGVL